MEAHETVHASDHMACEVATERSLSQAFQAKGLGYLEESVLGFLNGFSLASGRNQKLYTALTGDEIQQEPFWPEFKASASRRNSVVHHSKSVDRREAELSLSSAKAFVEHLRKC